MNYNDNHGFSLISAVDFEDPIIAVVPEGSFNPEHRTENPGFNLYLEAAKEHETNSLRKIGKLDPIGGDNPPYMIENGKYVKYVKETSKRVTETPLLGADMKWNQDGIYGQFCSNKLAGCAPLAVASLVAYFSYKYNLNPDFRYTYPRDILYEKVIWAEIIKHKSSKEWSYKNKKSIPEICWEEDSAAIHKTIGRICRQFGYEGNAEYQYGKTSMTNGEAKRLLKKYLPGLSVSDFKAYDIVATMKNIDKGALYLYGEGDLTESHAWICDAYDYTIVREKRYESETPPPSLNPNALNWVFTGYTTYCKETSLGYMHWGWGGDEDGWYNDKVMKPQDNRVFNKFYYMAIEKK